MESEYSTHSRYVMNRQLTYWLCFGIGIRLLIMPFSFHGHDIFWIYYFPFKFLTEGLWDPYLWLPNAYPHYHNTYYPPILFGIISLYLWIITPLLPNLPHLFAVFEKWNFSWQGNTIHYADILHKHDLYRTLFLFKVPYLLFDMGTGYLLYNLFKKSKKGATLFKLWMINPFVLQSVFALGQCDIIYTFFVVLSLYCFWHLRHYWSMFYLILGSFIKPFPVLLIPYVIVFMKNALKDKIKLTLFGFGISLLILCPFYLSSKTLVFKAFFTSNGNSMDIRQVLFLIGNACAGFYFLWCWLQKRDLTSQMTTVMGLSIPLLLFYVFYNVTIRYFILITPFLLILAVHNKRFWIYNILFLLCLFELRLGGNSQQWGLFGALHPEFFTSLPILDSFLNVIVDVKWLHQLAYRCFLVTSFVMIIDMSLIILRKTWKGLYIK